MSTRGRRRGLDLDVDVNGDTCHSLAFHCSHCKGCTAHVGQREVTPSGRDTANGPSNGQTACKGGTVSPGCLVACSCVCPFAFLPSLPTCLLFTYLLVCLVCLLLFGIPCRSTLSCRSASPQFLNDGTQHGSRRIFPKRVSKEPWHLVLHARSFRWKLENVLNQEG
ncbi:hypothetical protein BU24DRAFT_33025 [Aaosphaeria arxii CBS 175.79]|uniref:Uncharacterized protein n=1 Tax=Aaosphaeria arxii CBS 175.79 TaxID=1450172 RepID=A0A6A5YA94_9PLEO|nr:uncharacterized protein BU24DRAFT_33025 [Aaosphaeria arxii CBS 175.79]KAF2021937.1 hypothetical protein BU24DRAFT_33025 [Aaosphaeria arxii CBS 175.79]